MPDAILVTGLFRVLPNMYDRRFCEKSKSFNYLFAQKISIIVV